MSNSINHSTTGSEILIEAVPNFSEGRRPAVVNAIVSALDVPGVHILNYSSDWDHNRSVVTMVGHPDAVCQGLLRGIALASQEIDLFQHRGEHPRLGATDVVPLVPLQQIELEDCVTIARALGQQIGETLGLPVYLYEAAAQRPARRRLADVRRGQFEALINEIQLPARQPDFGPTTVGKAGAVIVGARPFLIAYNIYLQSADVQIAKRISRAIRESSGGLPAVRAIGLLVGGQAQVSMNLVDFQQTPIHVVFDEVKRLAKAEGVAIDRSELIGMLPQAALLQTAAHYLHLPSLTVDQIIEPTLWQMRATNRCAMS